MARRKEASFEPRVALASQEEKKEAKKQRVEKELALQGKCQAHEKELRGRQLKQPLIEWDTYQEQFAPRTASSPPLNVASVGIRRCRPVL